MCTTKHHAIKTYGGVEVQLHAFTSALGGGEWSASPPEKDSGAHWTGGWVGPRTGLDMKAKRKKSPAPAGIEPWSSSSQPRNCTDWATVAPTQNSDLVKFSNLYLIHCLTKHKKCTMWCVGGKVWIGFIWLRIKRPGSEADHSPPYGIGDKNAWSYTSTPPIRIYGVVLK
jgi:hypothetical protein